VLHKEKGWVIWWKANPKDEGEQTFREHSQCIFKGSSKESKRDKDSREEAPGGQHVTRSRSWWKRGYVSHVLSKPTWNVGCIHQDIILDDDKTHQSVKEAWEHEDDEDKLKIETTRSRRQF